MQPNDQSLCEAIRQKCAHQHWYGPDFCGFGWGSMITEHDLPRVGFSAPALREEEVCKAEEALGFPLPAALRTLYKDVANGGFGPYYGLFRLAGEALDTERTVLEFHQDDAERCEFFDLAERQRDPTMIFDASSWPRFVLRICEEGCGSYFCLHCRTGEILRIGIWDAHEYNLSHVASSLQEWLQRWLQGELYPERVLSPEEALAAERLLRESEADGFF